jgi:hypothetical protein
MVAADLSLEKVHRASLSGELGMHPLNMAARLIHTGRRWLISLGPINPLTELWVRTGQRLRAAPARVEASMHFKERDRNGQKPPPMRHVYTTDFLLRSRK